MDKCTRCYFCPYGGLVYPGEELPYKKPGCSSWILKKKKTLRGTKILIFFSFREAGNTMSRFAVLSQLSHADWLIKRRNKSRETSGTKVQFVKFGQTRSFLIRCCFISSSSYQCGKLIRRNENVSLPIVHNSQRRIPKDHLRKKVKELKRYYHHYTGSHNYLAYGLL